MAIDGVYCFRHHRGDMLDCLSYYWPAYIVEGVRLATLAGVCRRLSSSYVVCRCL